MSCSLRRSVPTPRRETIALLGAMAASTVAARAQPKTMRVIGYLGSESAEPYGSRLAALAEGVDDVNYQIDNIDPVTYTHLTHPTTRRQ